MMDDKNRQVTMHTTTLVKSDNSESQKIQVNIVDEHFMNLFINGKLAARFDCTMSNLKELVIGRMITERLIDSIHDVSVINFNTDYSRCDVTLNNDCVYDYKNEVVADLTSLASNKVYVKKEGAVSSPLSDNIDNKNEVNKEWVFDLAQAFSKETKIHKSTSGTHSCILSVNGNIVWTVEDIGRHNAIDKTIGYALLNGHNMKECIIFTSGRVSADMITKAINSGLPILVSKSVPTRMAVQMAVDNNIRLVCKAWPDSFEIYN